MKYIFLIALTFLSNSVLAEKNCNYIDLYGNPYCISTLNLKSVFQANPDSQYQSQWCWAASISNIFDFYDHPVNQDRIVNEAYGGLINLPAQGFIIAQQLNKSWIDDNGKKFNAELTGAYDYYSGIYSLNSKMVVDNLTAEKPLIIGTNGHAMTLFSVAYYETIVGPSIFAGQVFDPWPGIGWRDLSAAELTPVDQGGLMQFLVTANITETPNNTPPSTIDSNAPPHAGGIDIIYLTIFLIVFYLRRKL